MAIPSGPGGPGSRVGMASDERKLVAAAMTEIETQFGILAKLFNGGEMPAEDDEGKDD